MSMITNEDILQWLLDLYGAARETPLPQFRDDVFRRLQEMIPVSSALCTDSGPMSDGQRNYLAIHLYEEPPTVADEMPAVNNRNRLFVRQMIRYPDIAHIFPCYRMFPGREHAQLRNYLTRYKHQNLLLLGHVTHGDRLESLSLFRSRCDDHFTAVEQRLLTLLAPHLREALEISRTLSGMTITEPRSGSAGNGALVRTDGVLVTCGERFKQLLRTRWPDWSSLRLPGELMDRLRPGWQQIPTPNGGIILHVRTLGPYLFLQAGQERQGRGLSAREAETAQLFAAGKTYRQIAAALGLRPATVRNVLQKVYDKLQVGNKPELVLALLSRPEKAVIAPQPPHLPRDGRLPATPPP